MSDITTAYEVMNAAYKWAFLNAKRRRYYCPIKKVTNLKRVNGISVERRTILPAKTLNNHEGEKIIYVNDENGGYKERVRVDDLVFENKGITTFRCGIMTCVAIAQFVDRMNLSFDNVGFIGCGRTNLQNCKAINEVFHIGTAIIRGSDKNRGKSREKFADVINTLVDDTEDMTLLNKCNVVVVCTSNFEKQYTISTDTLYEPRLIIVLDCGYTLDESFRVNADSFTDYAEQINSDYDDEFPFDDRRYKMRQMVEDDGKLRNRVCVYLHGIGFADITIAEMMSRGELML